MLDPRVYWEQCFDGLDPETFDFSTARPSRVLVNFCKTHLRNKGPFIDLGCGNGNNAHYLAALGCRVFGVDISWAAVAFCRRRFLRFGLSGIFVQGNFDRIPFAAGSFSALLCLAVLDHVTFDTARASIAEMQRVLRSRGLALLTFAPQEVDATIVREAEKLSDDTLHFVRGIQRGMLFRRYLDGEIRNLLREFEIVSHECTEFGTRVVVCRRI